MSVPGIQDAGYTDRRSGLTAVGSTRLRKQIAHWQLIVTANYRPIGATLVWIRISVFPTGKRNAELEVILQYFIRVRRGDRVQVACVPQAGICRSAVSACHGIGYACTQPGRVMRGFLLTDESDAE